MTSSSTENASSKKSGRGLSIVLWIVQVLLAVNYAMAGVIKSTMSPENAVKAGVTWATGVPELLLHIIGVCELLAAIGLIFPLSCALNRSLPLTPVGDSSR